MQVREQAGGQPSGTLWSSRRSLFLLAQLAVLAAAWALLSYQGCRNVSRLPRLAPWSGGGSSGGNDTARPATTSSELFPHTSNISEWAAAPGALAFLAPQSRCLLDPRGELHTTWLDGRHWLGALWSAVAVGRWLSRRLALCRLYSRRPHLLILRRGAGAAAARP